MFGSAARHLSLITSDLHDHQYYCPAAAIVIPTSATPRNKLFGKAASTMSIVPNEFFVFIGRRELVLFTIASLCAVVALFRARGLGIVLLCLSLLTQVVWLASAALMSAPGDTGSGKEAFVALASLGQHAASLSALLAAAGWTRIAITKKGPNNATNGAAPSVTPPASASEDLQRDKA